MSNLATTQQTAIAVPIAKATKENVATEVSKILVLLGALDKAFEPQTKQQEQNGEPVRYTLEVRTAINYLSTHFKHLRVNELLLAFELAMEGKFECELNHYGNLNTNYFASVIRAYLKHKSAQQLRTTPVNKTYTEAEKAKIVAMRRQESIEYLLETFERYKTDKTVLISHTFVQLLNELGISLWPECFTNDMKQKAWNELLSDCYQQRKAELKNRMQIAGYSEIIDIKRQIDTLEPQSTHIPAQKQLIRLFFQQLIQNKLEVSDLIGKKTDAK
jgi:hypothetical protein